MLKNIPIVAILLLVASAATLQAQTRLNECVPINIKLNLDISRLPYQRINNRPKGRTNTLHKGRVVRGQAVQPLDISLDWELDGLPMRYGGTYCGRIKSVTLSAGQQPPAIWISPELEDECLRRAALEHERTHVSFFYDYLDELEATLPDVIASFNRTNAFTAPKEDLMKNFKVVVNEIRNEIQRAQTQATERLARQNAGIDTLEAYDRLQRACQ